jgi:hypothetical protein
LAKYRIEISNRLGQAPCPAALGECLSFFVCGAEDGQKQPAMNLKGGARDVVEGKTPGLVRRDRDSAEGKCDFTKDEYKISNFSKFPAMRRTPGRRL